MGSRLLTGSLVCCLFFAGTDSLLTLTARAKEAKADWAVYWYLCGSDLESNYGSASADLNELLSVSLPEGIRVVVETGGTKNWQKDEISADQLTRYLYDNKGFHKLEELEQADMGKPETLADFLEYCLTEHAAEHSLLIFWDHGAGSLGGVSFDANYSMDGLTLSELDQAFSKVRDSMPGQKEKLVDMIGFDACLMATIDTLAVCADYADWMVASQETEPVYGWAYDSILRRLAAEADIQPEQLGVEICDSYMDSCLRHEKADKATLALMKLDEAKSLKEAYEDSGSLMFRAAIQENAAAESIARAAGQTKSYGTNAQLQGYTNMVDLLQLTEQSLGAIDTAEADYQLKKLRQALNYCVIYQVTGELDEGSCGLSCYYPLDRDMRGFRGYRRQTGSADKDMTFLYEYLLNGSMNEEILTHIEEKGYSLEQEAYTPVTIHELGLETVCPVWIRDEEDAYVLVFDAGEEAVRHIAGVSTHFSIQEADTGMLYSFGDSMVLSDWEYGTFFAYAPVFIWTLEGHRIHTLLMDSGEYGAVYAIPAMLNGEKIFLRMVSNSDETEARVEGFFHESGVPYMMDRESDGLKEGDELTTLIPSLDMKHSDNYERDLMYRPYETFRLEGNLRLSREALPDGIVAMGFDLEDAWGNSVYSQRGAYQLKDGVITEIYR